MGRYESRDASASRKTKPTFFFLKRRKTQNCISFRVSNRLQKFGPWGEFDFISRERDHERVAASSVRARFDIVVVRIFFFARFFFFIVLSYFLSLAHSRVILSLSFDANNNNNINRQTVTTTTMSAAKKKVVPVRQYLDESVVPTLREAMKELVKVRPEDPHEFLAKYLMKHSPNQTTTTTTSKSSSGVGNNSSGIRAAENNVRNDKATGVEEREEGEEKKEKDEGDAA